MTEVFYDFETIDAGKPNPENYPATISPSWLDIQTMKSLYPHNQNFVKNIEKLWLEYSLVGWKKSRGDGNCYYRAVISSLFIKICKPYESITKLLIFYQKLQQLNISQIDPQYFNSIKTILDSLRELIELKNQGFHLQVLKNALALTQDKVFDQHLVRAARVFTYNEALKAQNSELYSFVEPDFMKKMIKTILTINEEAEDLILVFLPQGLGIQVIQFMFLEHPKHSVQKFPEVREKDWFVIFIVRRHGHYDILVSVSELEIDQVNLEEGTCRYFKNNEIYSEILSSIERSNCSRD